ncbi:hypothetical protein AAMO2058_000204300 [Amorphochlora amoebiformis]
MEWLRDEVCKSLSEPNGINEKMLEDLFDEMAGPELKAMNDFVSDSPSNSSLLLYLGDLNEEPTIDNYGVEQKFKLRQVQPPYPFDISQNPIIAVVRAWSGDSKGGYRPSSGQCR